MPDWSFGGFKNKLGGLLDDPEQLLSNPLFGAGMGLLSSRYDPSVNPFVAAMQGLAGAQQNDQAQADRQRIEELRQQLAALIAAQGGGMPGGAPGGMPPGAATPPIMPQQNGGPLMSPVPGGGQGSMTEQLVRQLGWRGVLGQ